MIVSLLAVYRGTDIVSGVINQITAFAIVYYSMILLIALLTSFEQLALYSKMRYSRANVYFFSKQTCAKRIF